MPTSYAFASVNEILTDGWVTVVSFAVAKISFNAANKVPPAEPIVPEPLAGTVFTPIFAV